MAKQKEEQAGKLNTDDKLDIIIENLRRMDKRDRLRTIGGFFKGIISMIPIIIMLVSIWYVYAHGDKLLQKITQQAAQEAANITGDSAGKLMEQINLNFPGER
tara:strand:+ start:338 stop:646 length:309 start_codon:yes stop_codon:yes gene_type:complete